MSQALLFALTGIGLFVIGLHALIVRTHLLHKILAFNVMGSGVFLVLAALSGRTATESLDPVPQAMIITGIVVAVAATALALALMLRVVGATGRATLASDDADPSQRSDR